MKTGRYIAKVPGINVYSVSDEGTGISRELKMNDELTIVKIERRKFLDSSADIGWINDHEYVILKSKFGTELDIEFMEKKRSVKKNEQK